MASPSADRLRPHLTAGGGDGSKAGGGAAAATGSADSAPSSSSPSLKSAAVFNAIQKRINADTVKNVKASYRFDLSPDEGGAAQSWVIDLKSGSGSVSASSGSAPADCVIAMKDGDFVLLMTGRLNPQSAFMKGKLRVRGNVMLAQKLNALMPSNKKKQQQPAQDDDDGTGGAGDEQSKHKLQSRL